VGRGIALLLIDLGARRCGWSAPHPGRFTPGKDPVPIVQDAGWASGPVWTCAKNLSPTGIRSSDRPARSQSLYRLSYPGPSGFTILINILYFGCAVDTCVLLYCRTNVVISVQYYTLRVRVYC
jgi:hypothetical protein